MAAAWPFEPSEKSISEFGDTSYMDTRATTALRNADGPNQYSSFSVHIELLLRGLHQPVPCRVSVSTNQMLVAYLQSIARRAECAGMHSSAARSVATTLLHSCLFVLELTLHR